MSYQLIIHGGANDLVHEDTERKEHCERIADVLDDMLKAGKNALEVCEKGVNMLEDDSLFNAGTGSYLQIDGKCRMDACIMDSNLQLGSVIQIENVKNPISVAKRLLEKNVHSTLCGSGALQFAQEEGFALHSPVVEKQVLVYLENMKALENDISYRNLQNFHKNPKREKLGTVGCVVRDSSGYIVSGTSTGGLRTCFPCRVGDSPLVGCGTYANPFAGISCTGTGEKIMRVTLARTVAFWVEMGKQLKEAMEKGMQDLESIGGDGGMIGISHTGEISFVHNTKVMSYAFRKA